MAKLKWALGPNPDSASFPSRSSGLSTLAVRRSAEAVKIQTISRKVRCQASDGVPRSDRWTPLESVGLPTSKTPEVGDAKAQRGGAATKTQFSVTSVALKPHHKGHRAYARPRGVASAGHGGHGDTPYMKRNPRAWRRNPPLVARRVAMNNGWHFFAPWQEMLLRTPGSFHGFMQTQRSLPGHRRPLRDVKNAGRSG